MQQSERIIKMRRALLAWYRKAKRDLPWRHTRDPYAIVLSEVMLQQTQVDRVLPKWRAWLSLFPTWQHLAQAKTADILKAWSGLGYNRRALMLQKMATHVITHGEFPRDEMQMRELPGVGPYTAAAVCAFAFRISGSAPVDTNIDRVLRRVFGYHKKDARAVAMLAQHAVPRDVASWNHALMDLGASKCTALKPQCETCPLQKICVSYPCAGGDIKKASQKKFAGSDRMYRGRLLRILHAQGTVERTALPRLLHLRDTARVARIIASMIADGFIEENASGEIRIVR